MELQICARSVKIRYVLYPDTNIRVTDVPIDLLSFESLLKFFSEHRLAQQVNLRRVLKDNRFVEVNTETDFLALLLEDQQIVLFLFSSKALPSATSSSFFDSMKSLFYLKVVQVLDDHNKKSVVSLDVSKVPVKSIPAIRQWHLKDGSESNVPSADGNVVIQDVCPWRMEVDAMLKQLEENDVFKRALSEPFVVLCNRPKEMLVTLMDCFEREQLQEDCKDKTVHVELRGSVLVVWKEQDSVYNEQSGHVVEHTVTCGRQGFRRGRSERHFVVSHGRIRSIPMFVVGEVDAITPDDEICEIKAGIHWSSPIILCKALFQCRLVGIANIYSWQLTRGKTTISFEGKFSISHLMSHLLKKFGIQGSDFERSIFYFETWIVQWYHNLAARRDSAASELF